MSPEQVLQLALSRKTVGRRWWVPWTIGLVGAAASLFLGMIAAGIIAPGIGTEPGAILIAKAEAVPRIARRAASRAPHRSSRMPGALTRWRGHSTSSSQARRSGDATVLQVEPGKKPTVYPRVGKEPIAVIAGQIRTYKALLSPTGWATLLVVVTYPDATDIIRNAMTRRPETAETFDAVLDGVVDALRSAGRTWAAIGRVMVEQVRESDKQ